MNALEAELSVNSMPSVIIMMAATLVLEMLAMIPMELHVILLISVLRVVPSRPTADQEHVLNLMAASNALVIQAT